MTELVYASATALAQAIRERRASSVEVVEAHLQHLARVNPVLNAVVYLDADGARTAARRADATLSGGGDIGPLHGVPITIKDSFDVAGMVTTCGTAGRVSAIATQDATAVARLRAAGAIVLGKTNLPEFAVAGETDNLVFGRTNNPYDLARTPGGSTGGEAAIIAAGGSPLGLGADIAGSIRMPAHCCGIVGLKPTSGRIPTTGNQPPTLGIAAQLMHVGPMARFVEDVALALPILSGIDWRDPQAIPMPLGDSAAVVIRHLRVAFHCENGIIAPTPETKAAIRRAAQALADAGAAVEEAQPPAIARTMQLFGPVSGPEGRIGLQRLAAEAGSTTVSPLFQGLLDVMRPEALTGTQIVKALAELSLFRSEMLSFMAGYDLLLSPVNAYPAVPHGEMAWGGEKVLGFSYTMTHNLTGWPVVVLRAGTAPGDLPIGVQVIARPWREDVALAAARQLEISLGGWQRPPL